MRIVFDTDVIQSAFLTEGLSQKVFESVLESHIAVISGWVINELKNVLSGKFGVPKNVIKSFTEFLRAALAVFDPRGEPPALSKDPDDNNILLLADHAKAEVIITGDKDLLILGKYKKCKILTPRQFYEEFISKQK